MLRLCYYSHMRNKKLWYLLPLLFLGLSLTPVSLYKDKVEFAFMKGSNVEFSDIFNRLSPRYWKVQSSHYNLNFSFSSSDSSQASTDYTPLYKGATFRGFPVAAYMSKSESEKVGSNSSSFGIRAYSWLWGAVDLVFVLSALILAYRLNQKSRAPKVAKRNA